MMKELVGQVKQLAQQELENSYKKFPKFNSAHEGYAVILEKLDEAKDEIQSIELSMSCLWENVKSNVYNKYLLEAMRQTTIAAASELIQTAAMVQKFIDSMDKPIEKQVEVSVRFMIHVNREQATEIIRKNGPKGLFYTINNGLYMGINTKNDKVLVKEFDDRQACFDWLNKEDK
jgi:hypothetical protein